MPAEYQQALTDLDTALGPGFTAIGTALTPADLSSAMSLVSTNLTVQAGTLEDIRPPRPVADAHEDLVSALDLLARELSSLSAAANRNDLCTGGSGLPRAASGHGAHLFRLAVTALATADPSQSYTVGGFLPAGSPDQNRRPGNGSLPGGRHGGYGELTVEAPQNSDAVVKLTESGAVVRSIFVQAGASTTVDGLPDGTFEAYYTVGSDWDGDNGRFTRDCAFSKFDQPLTFTTTYLTTYVEYTTYQLTLYEFLGGNASTSSVDAGTFPGG